MWMVCNPAAPAGVRGIPGLSPDNWPEPWQHLLLLQRCSDQGCPTATAAVLRPGMPYCYCSGAG